MNADTATIAREAERLAALGDYAILDSAPESGFDDIVQLAAQICEVPAALVSLAAGDRIWFKARLGFSASEVPFRQSVCIHALEVPGVLVIPDLSSDPRTANNPTVQGEPFLRFYGGAPLVTAEGVTLGSLCVIDTVARPAGLTATQASCLQALARQVINQMELRRILSAKVEADRQFRSQQTLLKDELNHRLKNILAMVQAIVTQTFRSTDNLEVARDVLSKRIAALGRAQEILFAGAVESASLDEILDNAARLHDAGLGQRFLASGPAIEVGPKAALSLTLLVHELATNAAKYGALSMPDGQVEVAWSIVAGADGPDLALIWRERGGPPVVTPTRRGFGTRLIERSLAGGLGGTVQLDFLPPGLECRLSAPLSALTALA